MFYLGKATREFVRRLPGRPVALWDGVWQTHKELGTSRLSVSGPGPPSPYLVVTQAAEQTGAAVHSDLVPWERVVTSQGCSHHHRFFSLKVRCTSDCTSHSVLCSPQLHSSARRAANAERTRVSMFCADVWVVVHIRAALRALWFPHEVNTFVAVSAAPLQPRAPFSNPVSRPRLLTALQP